MHNMSTWMMCLATIMLANGESPPGILKDPSFFRLLKKQYSVIRLPKAQWAFRPQEDFYRLGSIDVSHGYTSYPPYGSTSKERETSSERPLYFGSSQDFWRPSSVNSSFTSSNYQSHLRPYFGSNNDAGASFYQDYMQKSPSTYQYLKTRPTTGSHFSLKKTPMYHVKGKLQVQNFDALGKVKYKKTVLHHSPLTNQKTVYPRVHKPYAKHKYPAQKTIHPIFKRYYQSPYQRYSIPSGEMFRYRVNAHSNEYSKTSVSPTPTSEKYYTTERMDDTYPDGSATSEDYSAYNDTRHSEAGGNYYETYEEVEKTTSESEESSYDESATRGYYGDRIYMSTQTPLVTSDKASVKNKYFIIRRTSNDDDIETIFE